MTESTGEANQEIVCILGMHRSGTSLLARMLNLLGLDLGAEQLLMQPNEANPKGFWELAEIASVNDEILARFGGSWDEPPLFPTGWENDPMLDDLKQRARTLIQDTFASVETWGWKDPRSCLTLPFWQQLLPEMRYVVCLRNPVDVVLSLEQRDALSAEKGSHLWLTYVNSALEYSEGKPRLVIFYEDLMDDCLRELQGLADFLGKPERAKRVDVQQAVQEFLEKGLQHHRTSVVQATASPRISLRARALYIAQRISVSFGRKQIDSRQELDHEIEKALDILSQYSFNASGQANPLIEQLTELDDHWSESRNTIRVLRARLLEQDQEIATLRAQAKVSKHVLRARDKAIAWLKAQADERENVIRARDEAIAWLKAQADEKGECDSSAR